MFERFEKMDRRALVALVVAIGVALLIFGGVASGIRQSGWNEGFLVGMLSSGGTAEGGQALNPYLAARGYGGHSWGWHPLGFIGGFFHFLFFGFLLMAFFRFMACRRWAHHGGHPGGPWAHHPGHHWGGQRGGESQQPQTTEPQGQSMTQQASDPMPNATDSGQSSS